MASIDVDGRTRRFAVLAVSARHRAALLAIGIALGASLVGCRPSGPELAPVRGSVTIDGRPLRSGRVMFAPIASGEIREAGKPAFGTLQPDGSYVLTTFRDQDGAVVGEHWITIFGPAKEPSAGGDEDGPAMPKFHRFVVRQKQSIVGGQQNRVDIQLKAGEIARFAAQK